MPKLLSVNMEGDKHYDKITSLLEQEKPDIVCLQEAPNTYLPILSQLGYHAEFAPMCRKSAFVMGIVIASPQRFVSQAKYYHRTKPAVADYNPEDKIATVANPYLIASLRFDDAEYTIATTHVMVTKDGAADDHQRQGLATMLQLLATEPPHCICGDLNIPRGYNELYPHLLARYTDTIPASYTSSLDPVLHRLASAGTEENIFERYMVDYLFTQVPYLATDVRLQFGVSDHAAIIANLTRSPG